MAIFSTHLLNSMNGSHANNVEIIIYKTNGMDRTIFLEAFTDEGGRMHKEFNLSKDCLLYTSPSPRDMRGSRMPSSA